MRPERHKQALEITRATLEVTPPERSGFLSNACAGDPELRREVESLLPAGALTGELAGSTSVEGPTGALDEAPTIPLSDEEQQELLRQYDIGPYRIIRQLGQGGMGTVYLAERSDEYKKQVAIKLIKRGMDSEFVLRRFRNERQILASLEHSNIARLLDGGTTPDGRPYFVMEYIEGQPITRFCDEQMLSTVERLNLLRQVCAAVHYAHQNLVIHRDIKPANILVTAGGVPKLLDFGIAKLLNPELGAHTVDATAAAVRLMTPEYASPEQVKGDTITTATDVYSLGVVLYELLTGHRPYRFASFLPHEVLRVICSIEPEKPSTVVGRKTTMPSGDSPATLTPESVSRTREGEPDKLRRRLRGDLDNIVLMAMRKEPGRRYASVAQLANDIQRHLEGRPVVARADTLWYRTGKFVRRNKLAVAAAVVIFLTLVGGIVATTLQRTRAERRFNEVRQLANALLFELHDAVKDLPGSMPARELVIKKALLYLDSLAAESSGDPALQRELATAYDKVGDLQGGLYQANLGNTEGARESYAKALRVREALAASDPSDQQVLRGMSESYTRLGQLSWTGGDPAGSAEWHRKAMEIDEQLAAANPNDPNSKFAFAAGRMEYGFMLAASGKIQDGLAILKESLPLFESVAGAENATNRFKDGLGTAYERVATVLAVGTPHKEEALTYYAKSLEIRETLLAANPQNADFIRGVAASHGNIGETQQKMGNLAGAIASHKKAMERLDELATVDPRNDQLRQDRAFLRSCYADALAANGEGARAMEEANRAREALEPLLASDPTSVLVRFRVALSHESLGNAHAALGSDTSKPVKQRKQHWLEARVWFENALKVYRELRDNGTITGDDAAKVEETETKLARCTSELAKLK